MKTPSIIIDECGDVREWVPITTYLSLVTVALILIFTLAYPSPCECIDNSADLKAFCDSIGGSFGDKLCYKDGEAIWAPIVMEEQDGK